MLEVEVVGDHDRVVGGTWLARDRAWQQHQSMCGGVVAVAVAVEPRAASHSHDKARLILPLSTPVSFSVAISRM